LGGSPNLSQHIDQRSKRLKQEVEKMSLELEKEIRAKKWAFGQQVDKVEKLLDALIEEKMVY